LAVYSGIPFTFLINVPVAAHQHYGSTPGMLLSDGRDDVVGTLSMTGPVWPGCETCLAGLGQS
jgi:hypothetical protein